MSDWRLNNYKIGIGNNSLTFGARIYWEYHPHDIDGAQMTSTFPSDEHGWISSNHKPPARDQYLVTGDDGFWGGEYWDGEKWLSTYPVDYWKPVVLPEKEKENRYDVKFYGFHDEFVVRDNDKDVEIAGFSSKSSAYKLIDYLEDTNISHCQCS